MVVAETFGECQHDVWLGHRVECVWVFPGLSQMFSEVARMT